MKYSRGEIIKAIEQNLYDLSLLPADFLGSKSGTGEISFVYTGTSQLNRVFNINLKQDVELRVNEVLQVFKNAGVPVNCILDTSTVPKDLGKSLENLGVSYSRSWTGMAFDMDILKKQKIDFTDCDIQKVRDEDTLKLWNSVVCKGFGMPEGTHDDFYKIHNFLGVGKGKPWSHYLVIKDGLPSAACTMYRKDGIAGLYWVATLPEARRKGLATKAVYRALYDAYLEGYDLAILQASDAGRGVYEKMGFKAYNTFNLYTWKP